MPKCLVNIMELNGDDNWGKYPIDQAGHVLIRPIKGKYNETPMYDPEAIHRTKGLPFPIPFIGPFHILRKRYLPYPRLTNQFLKREAKVIPSLDLNFIEKVAKGKIMKAYDPESDKPSFIPILTLLILLALFFVLVIIPNARV